MAVLLVGRAVGAGPDARLSLGVSVAIAVLAQLVRETAAEPQPPAPLPEPAAPGSAEYLARLRQLQRRLEAASRDGSKYDRNVRPLLVRLATDRVRLKHGIDVTRQPGRARELMGEQLWLLISTPAAAGPGPSRAQLSALLDSIEAL